MKHQTPNNFYSYSFILGALFILIFFTKNIFSEFQIKSEEVASQEQVLETQRQELTRLGELQKDLQDSESEAIGDIKGFSGVFSDDTIIDHIYSYAQKVNLGDERVIVRNISIGSPGQSDIGFQKTDISLQVIASGEAVLFGFLNFLTDKDESYRFYISQFEYDMSESSGNISVSIPLTLYHQ